MKPFRKICFTIVLVLSFFAGWIYIAYNHAYGELFEATFGYVLVLAAYFGLGIAFLIRIWRGKPICQIQNRVGCLLIMLAAIPMGFCVEELI